MDYGPEFEFLVLFDPPSFFSVALPLRIDLLVTAESCLFKLKGELFGENQLRTSCCVSFGTSVMTVSY